MQQSEPPSERRPLLDEDIYDDEDAGSVSDKSPDAAPPWAPAASAAGPHRVPAAARPADASWLQRNRWIALALGSGACAAFNAVFAKLTTTSSTGLLAERLAALLGLARDSTPAVVVEVALRGFFFALNLCFDAVMWTIFTQALKRAASTTQVAVLNTSSNFLLTGLLGLAVFAEALPLQWWAGAVLLVAGTFVAGRAGEAEAEAEAKARRAAEPDAEGLAPADGVLLLEPVVAAQTADEPYVAEARDTVVRRSRLLD